MDGVSGHTRDAQNRRGLPLSVVILRYFAYVLMGSLALALIVYVVFGISLGGGGVYPANYGDTALAETSERLAELPADDVDAIDAVVPSTYRWAVFSADGTYLAGDAPASARDALRAASSVAGAIDYGQLSAMRYEPVTLADGSVCVLMYEYMPQFVSKQLRDVLPNPQNLFLGLYVALAVGMLVGIAVRASRVLSRKMAPLVDAAHRIEERELDFEVERSNVREVNDALVAMDDMRASLKNSLEAQWRAEQVQREQVAALVHDLKTPLTVVRGNADLLLEGELDSATRSTAQDVAIGARQMGEYVEKLVDVSRGGAVGFTLADVDVRALVSALQRSMEALVASAGSRVVWMAGELPVCARIDASLVERAVTNVVVNALDFAPVGSPVTVTVRQEESGVDAPGVLVFEVADEGSGFSPEALQRGCEAFFQADQARAARGHSGLGLHVAADAAVRHGGSVALANRDEGGALVTLRFPLT